MDFYFVRITFCTPISCCAPGLLSYSYYFAYIPQTICSQDRLSTKAEVYFGFSHNKKFSSTPPFCFLPCVFFYSIRVDPGQDPTSLLSLKICTPVANTGKLRSIDQMPVDLMWVFNALTLWTPISCCAPGLLSYSYYFAYIPPTTCSQDRLST
jgi:hypothetical protein